MNWWDSRPWTAVMGIAVLALIVLAVVLLVRRGQPMRLWWWSALTVVVALFLVDNVAASDAFYSALMGFTLAVAVNGLADSVGDRYKIVRRT